LTAPSKISQNRKRERNGLEVKVEIESESETLSLSDLLSSQSQDSGSMYNVLCAGPESVRRKYDKTYFPNSRSRLTLPIHTMYNGVRR
jgi:hypothetical protein